MSDHQALDFWHAHLGRHLMDGSADESAKAQVPTRMKKGIGLNALGAWIDAYYIVTPDHSWLIGKVERENSAAVEYVPSDEAGSVSGEQFIARWLISEELKMPCLIGVIGNANPNASFCVSLSPSKMHFCEAGSGFSFDVNKVKRAKEMMGALSWRDVVGPALRQYYALVDARATGTEFEIQKENAKMLKLLAKTPELAKMIVAMDIRPGSGEYVVLSWLFRMP